MAIWHKLVWNNIDELVENPTVGELFRLWSKAQASRGAIPSTKIFNVQNLRSHSPRLMLLQEEGGDFKYLHYGTDIQQHSQFDMTGRMVSEFGGELSEFFLERYSEVVARQVPLYTVHFAERAKSVLTWERLIMPLSDEGGRANLLVYNTPLEVRHMMLDAVINASDDAILAIRPLRNDAHAVVDWLVLVANARGLALLGAPQGLVPDMAVGRKVSELFPGWASLPLHTHCLAGVASNHDIEFSLLLAIKPNHGKRNLSGRVRSLGDGCVLRLTDITEQKNYEALLLEARRTAEAAAQSKASFLATMSHEIRTPMNGIIGMTSLLLETQQTQDQNEITEVIRSSSESLLTIVNDILDYSKIESGQMQLEWSPMDVQDALESSIELMAVTAQQKRLNVMYIMDTNVPRWLYGDYTRLRQVLVNLISNALKFTSEGEVLVHIRRAPATETVSHRETLDTRPHTNALLNESVALEISVADTGIGISPDEQRRLFQPFSQVDSSTSRRFGGTGLGLVICQRLVAAMGGRIWVESDTGKGARFCFTFRAEKAQNTTISGPEASALIGKKILVLDSSATNLRVLRLQAQRWGVAAKICSSQQEALTLLEADEAFDAVLTGMHASDANGLAFVQAVHVLAQDLPVILLTSQHVRTGDEQAGFAAVVVRPARQLVLFDALLQALNLGDMLPGRMRPVRRALFDSELAARHPLRVLLVEDNEVNIKVALRLLGGFGYRADVARDGIEAVDAVRRQAYDLVLMDIQMPRMDGIEATRAVVAEYTDGISLAPRIIGMSANALREDIDRAVGAGMAAYITKPIGVAELADVLTASPRLTGGRHSPSNFGGLSGFGSLPGTLPSPLAASTRPSTLAPITTAGLDFDMQTNALNATPLDMSVLDSERTGPIIELDPSGDFLAELTESLLENVTDLLAKMRAAAERGNAAELARLAHQVKGLSANLGVARLSATCAGIEARGLAGELQGVAACVDDGVRDLRQGVVALRALTERLRAG